MKNMASSAPANARMTLLEILLMVGFLLGPGIFAIPVLAVTGIVERLRHPRDLDRIGRVSH
jgi:hypothetical protein